MMSRVGPVSRSEVKKELADALNACLRSLGLSQQQASTILGVPQSKISAIVNNRLDGISAEKLMQLLTLLHRDVEIRIRPASAKGRLHVLVA